MIAAALRPALGSPLGAYLRLEIRRQLRNRRFLIVTMALPLTLYLMYTAVLKLGADTPGAPSLASLFLASMATYGAMAAAMSQANPIAVERATGWTRQLRTTPLPRIGYVLTKLATAMLLTVPAVALVSAAAVVVNHVDLPLATIAELVLAIGIGAAPFAALGILLGYLLDVDSAQGAMTLAFFGLAIFGGLFFPIDSFPEPLATIARVLPSYHLGQVARSIVTGASIGLLNVAALAAYALLFGGLAAWRYRAVERRSGA